MLIQACLHGTETASCLWHACFCLSPASEQTGAGSLLQDCCCMRAGLEPVVVFGMPVTASVLPAANLSQLCWKCTGCSSAGS